MIALVDDLLDGLGVAEIEIDVFYACFVEGCVGFSEGEEVFWEGELAFVCRAEGGVDWCREGGGGWVECGFWYGFR